MAVTTSYSFRSVEAIDPDFISGRPDAASLSGGGVVVTGDYVNNSQLDLFNSDGDDIGGSPNITGFDSAVSQLSNGNVVVATDNGNDVSFRIVDGTGNTVVADTANGATFNQLLEPDVAGLTGGGFVVATQSFFSGTNNDINLTVRNNNGSLASNFSVDTTTANDQNPSVAGLNDGGYVVAWHRNVGSSSEMWWAVYEANGALRKAPTLFDNTGTINRNASVVALGDGGFAIAYEDNGVGGDVDIILARFDAAGAFVDQDDISQNTRGDTAPSATVLSNGMIAVGSITDAFDDDMLLTLVDQNTGVMLQWGIFSADGAATSAAVAGMDQGQVAAFDTTAGDVVGDVIQAERMSAGDAAADTIIGDDLVDIVSGGDGADTIRGGLNADFLVSDAGEDTFLVGTGEAGGDTIDGGVDLDRILAVSDTNLITSTVLSIEEIEFIDLIIGSPTLTFNLRADQIGGGRLASDLQVDGTASAAIDILRITMGADTSLNLSAFTFQDFDTSDRILVIGDNDAEAIAGSPIRDDINGGGGNDVLTGGGGKDVLRGGLGNDVYVVNAQGEAVEGLNKGIDTVRTTANYTLGVNLERLVLLGTDDLRGTGNALDNRITGNAGDNTLNGLRGDDLLTGRGGADRFVFSTALNAATNVDTITDFQAGADEVRLDNAMFSGLSAGGLAASAFRIGGSAQDGNDRIIYNQNTGNLFFDQDGAGGAAQTLFAKLDPGLAPTASDFFVF